MSYPGGKAGSGTYHKLINLMPPHVRYIEPFLGGAAIMLRKRPAEINIGMDRDPAALESARAAVIAKMGQAFWECRRPTPHPAMFHFFERDGLAELEAIAATPYAEKTLIYCDPPYMMETRTKKSIYLFEMDDVDHRRLLRCLRSLKCYVMLSGYWSQLYADELADWNAMHFPAMTRGGLREEWLWFNFPPPAALHDYRYLGDDYRERERIKRRTNRWTARLKSMPRLERLALLHAIQQTNR